VFDINGLIGILDEDTKKVWMGYESKLTDVGDINNYKELTMYTLPENYGEEKVATIGGIGKTLRITGLIKGCAEYMKTHKFVAIYVTNIEDKVLFEKNIKEMDYSLPASVEYEHCDDDLGLVAEICCDLDYLHVLVAKMYRIGCKVQLLEKEANSFECLGIERLDRRDDQPKRAPSNWNYSFLPDRWHGVPTMWRNLADNFLRCDIDDLQHPLKQYVAALNIAYGATNSKYTKYINEYKWVSAALEPCQSSQLLAANYLLNVEQVKCNIQKNIAACIQYRYLITRGYSARWLGKYDQNAAYLGNGNSIRKFTKLNQYCIDELDTKVLEKIYKKDGQLRGKGNKGSRSKYAPLNEKYVPKRTMKRTLNIVDVMRKKPCLGETGYNDESDVSVESDESDEFD